MSTLRRKIHDHPLLVGVLGGVALSGAVAGAVGLYLMFGGFDIAASSPHAQVVGLAVHSTMKHSVKARAPKMATPVDVSTATLLSGAAVYGEHCVECHGGPGFARAHWVSAMLPTPPFLLESGKDWTHGELFEIVSHGVKMTGMPAWGEVMPRQKIDDVVTFVEYLPSIKPAEFARLMKASPSLEGSNANTKSNSAASRESATAG